MVWLSTRLTVPVIRLFLIVGLSVGAVESAEAFKPGDQCKLNAKAKFFKKPKGKAFTSKLKKGERVTLQRRDGDRWLARRANGRTGFLNAAYIKKVCKVIAALKADEKVQGQDSSEPKVAKSSPVSTGSQAKTEASVKPASATPSKNSVSQGTPALDSRDTSDKTSPKRGEARLVQPEPQPPSATTKAPRSPSSADTLPHPETPHVSQSSSGKSDEKEAHAKLEKIENPVAAVEVTGTNDSQIGAYLSFGLGLTAFVFAGYSAFEMREAATTAKSKEFGSQQAAYDAGLYARNANIGFGVGVLGILTGIYFLAGDDAPSNQEGAGKMASAPLSDIDIRLATDAFYLSLGGTLPW